MTSNPLWVPGLKISNFRLDPTNSSTTGMVYVDFIRFIANKPPLVTSLTVKSEGDAIEISGIGGTLQLSASVLPVTADSTVKWSVNNPAIATINEKGLLTAVSNGIVTVKATARDGSDVYGTKDIRITTVTSIGNLDLAPINIYPNPATNQLTVNSEQLKVDEITIFDLQGRAVYINNESFTGTKTFNLSLKKGLYLIKPEGNGPFSTQKLIVE